jgi:hypothetical protein
MTDATTRSDLDPTGDRRSVPVLLRSLVDEVSQLLRSEMQLARAETRENLSRAGDGVMKMVAGGLLGFAALIVLLQALVIALSNLMPPGWAALLVGLVVAVIGYAMLRSGQNALRTESLMPTRTIDAARSPERTATSAGRA